MGVFTPGRFAGDITRQARMTRLDGREFQAHVPRNRSANRNQEENMMRSSRVPGPRALAVVALLLSTASAAAQQPPPPPPRAIPGITADDPAPNACISCHVNMPDRNLDARLSTLVRSWYREVPAPLAAKARAAAPAGLTLKGRHPQADSSFKDIPGACLKCHGRTAKMAPPFAQLLHLIHLTGGAENHFMTMFQGECTLCHKLARDTGKWSIPSGPEG